MSDNDEDYRSMAISTRDELADDRSDWEPIYENLVPDFEALDEALDGLDNLTGRTGSSARMKAEQAALDAAVPVINGLRAVQLDKPSDALAGLAKLNRWKLDNLRDTLQVDKLRELVKGANGVKTDLAKERVTAAQLTTLDEKTEDLANLVGSPRKQVIADAEITAKEGEWMAKVRAAIKRLDKRVPNLQSELPETVRKYKKARKLIKLGGRSKKDKPQE